MLGRGCDCFSIKNLLASHAAYHGATPWLLVLDKPALLATGDPPKPSKTLNDWKACHLLREAGPGNLYMLEHAEDLGRI